MTKQGILEYFKDINHAYNESTRLDDLSHMLDELMQSNSDEPMQVELEGDGYADGELVYDYGKCPKCAWEFEYGDKDWEEPYCCHCGQKLHWFESEEQE